ncbi:Hsp20/alpha crystallin family protein [Streptomyces sp. NPDC060048]|uniref:Hsp20/alpha crystallin family protein n=1 Tax=unclassified Streptomyces TaxID=2593676 RepID=UPI0036866852
MVLPMRRGSGLPERVRPSWDPFRDFENMWGAMGRLREQTTVPATGGGQWLPMAEEEETEDAYVVRMELPGVPGENVNIELDDKALSISGEITEEHRGKVLSRRTGTFSYRTSLPGAVNAEQCEADLSEGLLTVRVPKMSGGGRHKIELKSKGGSVSIEGTQGAEGVERGQGAPTAPTEGTEGRQSTGGSPGSGAMEETGETEGGQGPAGLTGDVA